MKLSLICAKKKKLSHNFCLLVFIFNFYLVTYYSLHFPLSHETFNQIEAFNQYQITLTKLIS